MEITLQSLLSSSNEFCALPSKGWVRIIGIEQLSSLSKIYQFYWVLSNATFINKVGIKHQSINNAIVICVGQFY
jgi:hypothetical protein